MDKHTDKLKKTAALYETGQCSQCGRHDGPEVAPNALWPGQVQAAAYVLAALLGALAIIAGLCLLGCLMAWVIAEGPEMPAELAGLTRRQGVTAGIFAWVAGLVGYVWGKTAR